MTGITEMRAVQQARLLAKYEDDPVAKYFYGKMICAGKGGISDAVLAEKIGTQYMEAACAMGYSKKTLEAKSEAQYRPLLTGTPLPAAACVPGK